MSRKFITIATTAALGVALLGATAASAQKSEKLNKYLNQNQPMQSGGSTLTFQRQSADYPRRPQTRPPAWKPTLSDKADTLNAHLNKDPSITKVGESEPTFMRQGGGYTYPPRPRPRH